MKKYFWIAIMVLFITGCSSQKVKPKVHYVEEIKGITMKIKDGTLNKDGATIIINDTNGERTYAYSDEFSLEMKKDNDWETLEETGNECPVKPRLYYVDAEGYLELNQNWECMYGSLKKGTYRLIKSTYLTSNEEDKKYFAVEFALE